MSAFAPIADIEFMVGIYQTRARAFGSGILGLDKLCFNDLGLMFCGRERGVMGTWNTGNFSNDVALDYISEIASMDDLNRPINSIVSGSLDYVDADIACEALAASDLLAAMIGRPAKDLPEKTQDLLSKFNKPSTDMLTLARTATAHILEASELVELWNGEDSEAWKDVVGNLLQRLDPDMAYEPQSRETAVEGGSICSICEEIVPDDELIRAEIGFPNMPDITMGWYFHRSCIEANFRPPYFSKQGEIQDSLKEQIEQYLHNKNNNRG